MEGPKKDEIKNEEQKDLPKEEKKEEDKKEEVKEEKKEETTNEINNDDKKEEAKDNDDKNEGVLVKPKIDEKLGIENAVEDKYLKSGAKTWDDLGIKQEIHKALLAMDFIEPSAIQALTFPLIMKEPRLSLVAQAKNGSGKTAAFGLGVISSVDENSKDIQAVVLGLNRELVIQITDVLSKMAKETKIKVTAVLKGEEPEEYGQIIVITPVFFESSFLKRNKEMIKNLKIMVLDEADEIIRTENVAPSIKRAFNEFKRGNMNVQILFFSATFDIKCFKFIKEFYKTLNVIELKKEELTLKNVTQLYESCKNIEEKTTFVENYLTVSTGAQKVIIFANERAHVVKLKENLERRGKRVYILMGGDMSKSNRDETIKRFRSGEIQILITTNLLARGYDERSVKLVINFDLPVKKTRNGFEPDYETYLHRIGRTGRFGSKGIGVNLCCGKRDYEILQKIEKYYNTKIDKMQSMDELIEQLKKFLLEDN